MLWPPPSVPTTDYPDLLNDMWVRDACAQYHAYLGIFASGGGQPEPDQLRDLGYVIEGIVRTCSKFLTLSPGNITAHAFDKTGVPTQTDYEPDSLAYLIFLAWSYESVSGLSSHLDKYFWEAMRATVKVLGTSDVDGGNLHTFEDGSALTLTPNRPSDDKAQRNYNIPVNAFCAVAMEQLADLAQRYSDDNELYKAASKLGSALRLGVETKGTAGHSSDGQIYAYETNAGVQSRVDPDPGPCFVAQDGTPIFMDDANIPSLLSLPYLGFCAADDPTYVATRGFLLSPANPFYFTGTDGKTKYEGIGSCHTQDFGGLTQSIWPLAITMRGLTSSSEMKKMSALQMLVAASRPECSTISYGCLDKSPCNQYRANGYIHESFQASDPAQYTRGWFAWANALFGEWIDTMVREGTLPP